MYEGGSKSPCKHLFSLHMGHFYKGGSVYLKYETFSFMPCNMDRVACLVAYGISIKTMHMRHCLRIREGAKRAQPELWVLLHILVYLRTKAWNTVIFGICINQYILFRVILFLTYIIDK